MIEDERRKGLHYRCVMWTQKQERRWPWPPGRRLRMPLFHNQEMRNGRMRSFFKIIFYAPVWRQAVSYWNLLLIDCLVDKLFKFPPRQPFLFLQVEAWFCECALQSPLVGYGRTVLFLFRLCLFCVRVYVSQLRVHVDDKVLQAHKDEHNGTKKINTYTIF